MKITIRIILNVLLIAICVSIFSIGCFAKGSKSSDNFIAFPSNVIDESKVDIPSLISEKVTKEQVDKLYDFYFSKLGLPEIYYLDPDIYVLEYYASRSYWSGISEMNYKGLTENWSTVSAYPTIYIPLIGVISDTQGEPHNRVIGYVKLSYDWINEEYSCSPVLYTYSADNYKDGQSRPFEALLNYLTQSKTVAEQVFLLRHQNSLSDFTETIAVIKTEDDTVILDISDSLHLTSSVDDPAVAYTIEEYRMRRLEVEKELYKTVDRWEDVQYGGSGASSNQNQSKNSTEKWVAGILCVSLAAGIITFGLMKKRLNSRH